MKVYFKHHMVMPEPFQWLHGSWTVGNREDLGIYAVAAQWYCMRYPQQDYEITVRIVRAN